MARLRAAEIGLRDALLTHEQDHLPIVLRFRNPTSIRTSRRIIRELETGKAVRVSGDRLAWALYAVGASRPIQHEINQTAMYLVQPDGSYALAPASGKRRTA